ncbi:conjugative transfer protein MobI(A/C) [Vibrio hannami]|uniref:conjugative transfer protein MobI(A/C) n=1 Tax=Vibrio hannami TaxID=2717094 RepID=UPI002410669A|nr:conjugative transfer protein MobI(A/C) [Vibrio hannami]MDG3087810.1 conjugative transfer protein MobI(A/C) [Vibrio hannami]
MKEIQKLIYEKIDELFEEAQMFQEGWMNSIARREINRKYGHNVKKEHTRYQLRLEFSGSSFKIRWYLVTFVKYRDKVHRTVKSVSIRPNGKPYDTSFHHADPWEHELIFQVEKYLSIIRHKLKHLMKAHYNLLNAAKGTDEEIKAIAIKDRVTPRDISIKRIKRKLIDNQ